MKTESIRKALLAAESYIGDRSAGSMDFWDELEPARKELAALTALPDDVARDVEAVRSAIHPNVPTSYWESQLDRLAAGAAQGVQWERAARVYSERKCCEAHAEGPLSLLPCVEPYATAAARVPGLEALLRKTHVALGGAETVPMETVLDTVAVLARCRYEQYLHDGQEVADLLTRAETAEADALALAQTAEESEKGRIAAESERDAARKEVEKKKARIRELQGDVATARQEVETLRRRLDAKAVDELAVERLTARVAELEREKKALEEGIAPLRDTRRLMGADLAAAEARATAAEAKAARLEADARALTTQLSDMQVERNRALDYQKVLRVRFDTARNDALEEAAVRVDVEAQESHTREAAALLDDVAKRIRSLKSQSAPAPAPGLREAVVKCPSCEGRGYPGEVGCGRGGQGSCPECKGTGRDLDAPEPSVPASASDVLKTFTPESIRAARAEMRTEPSVTHAALAAVVDAFCRNPYEWPNGCTGPEDGAREVLRRATGGKVPEVRVPWARAWKTLAKQYRGAENYYRDMRRGLKRLFDENKAKAAKWDAAVLLLEKDVFAKWLTQYAECTVEKVAEELRTLLGLTLPTGPASPPSGPGGGNPPESPDGSLESRHPSVTPKGPALAFASVDMASGPDIAVRSTFDKDGRLMSAQPEPAAPEVAWEGDGVRVLADGWWTHDGRHTHNVSVAGVLARALAEAKRERAEYADVAARALVKAVEEASQLGAQDMRDRAASVVSALCGFYAGETLRLLVAIESDIRALPLK